MVMKRDHFMVWSSTKFLEIKSNFMKIQFRKGYENYKEDLHHIFDLIFRQNFEIVEERTDGSFYAYSVKLFNSRINSIRVYHEFIENQLIVTLNIGNDFLTTLELNKRIGAFKDSDLKPNGEEYLSALSKNAEIIKGML